MNRISPASQRLDVIGDRTPRGARKRLWQALCSEAAQVVQQEPALAGFVERVILAHDDFGQALAALLARKNVVRISLGPRILRADTAAVAALTLVQAAIGDWR